MLKIVFTFILVFAFICIKAQKPDKPGIGKITGRIVDSLTGEPVEYATISILKQESKKIVDGGTTDDKGLINISNIKEGNYQIQVYFIGYKTFIKNDVVISPATPNVFLGDISLASQKVLLKEVSVTAEKNLIENKIDKLVYNAEKDVSSQGGVATDILKKVPMVSVNADGSVELQGNSNIRFLINGKPSTIFGNNITDVLQTIPASQIQSIEVITSPGAKYDAEGTGGIINIILKKVTIKGINGSVSLTGGTRLQNGSFNLAVRRGKFGINTFLSGNGQIPSETINSMNRVSTDPLTGNSSSLLQNGTSDFTRLGYQGGVSFDWSPSEKDNLNGGISYNYFGNNTQGTTYRESISRDGSGLVLSDVNNKVIAVNDINTKAYDWNLNYKRKLKKEGQELDLLYTSSLSNNYSYYEQQQKYISSDSVYSGSYGKNPGSDMQTNLSLNYTHPVNEKFIFETGAKTVLYQVNSNANVFLLNPQNDSYAFNTSQSNSVNYSRNVYAAYMSSTFKLKYFDLKAGVRDEYTETNAKFLNAATNIPVYNTIVPSGVVSHAFKNNHTLKLSYSYRIQRPDYRDLNPFVNASDPKNLSTGNPALKPETTHNIELGYSKFFNKGININVNTFYRGNRADIQTYQRYYDSYQAGDSIYSNVAVSTRENIGREDNFGMNVFASGNIKKKFTLRTNISAFQRYIYSSIDPGANISGFNYRANLNLSYQFTETFIVEVFGNFNSPRLNIQGKMPSFTTYNFALRKQFYDKKMSIAFTTTNPFNKYVNQRTETKGINFTSSGVKELPYRSFGLNFTYKFGKLEFKKQRDPEDANLTNPPVQGN
ncbi:MAG: TonB-dependent receptor [Bacteroidetes bacterium]|nr:TonB-dependent receptor [Bacteroidota bacterium]